MHSGLTLNLLLAFLEGLGLILSPCILPVLPIVLASGVDGGKARPYGLVTGFILTFSLFTLLSRSLVQTLGVDPEALRLVSFWLLLAFGVILLSERLSEKFAAATGQLAEIGQAFILKQGQRHRLQNRPQGFFSGLVLGSATGLIWTPCAGPILSAVLVQTIRQETDLSGALTVLAFACGTALPLFIITSQGNRLMHRLNFLKTHSVAIRKGMGALIIATVLVSAQGSLFRWNFSLAGGAQPARTTAARLTNALPTPYEAPAFSGIAGWINTPGGKPLTMQGLRGKVVLVDFWTYSCINCVRTLPYLTAWDRKYRDQGLVIVGVSAPEFEFEKKRENVQQAVNEHHIQYPVALDNRLDTWSNFNNRYWPAHYLIDRSGRVVYTHFGEGEYAVTEGNIRALLGKGDFTAKDKPLSEKPEASMAWNQTPETYLGYARASQFASPQRPEPSQIGAFTFPGSLALHHWALQGPWFIDAEKIIAQGKNAALRLRFSARKVFLVMAVPPGKSVQVKVSLNGKPAPSLTVNRQTLYTVLSLPKAQEGTLTLTPNAPGLSAYAFTFGN